MVATRRSTKRTAPGQSPAEDPCSGSAKRSRRDQPGPAEPPPSPPKALIRSSPPKASPLPLPKGRRGAALVAAAGGTAPPPLASPPKPASATRPSPEAISAAAAAAAPQPLAQRRQQQQSASPRREALLRQALPDSYATLEKLFSALQVNYEVLRNRGRCTYQTLRAAVEEHSGKRFTTAHLSQLHFLLPDVLCLEWVRLPVAPHSSRTEPQLAISLGPLPESWGRPAGDLPQHAHAAGAAGGSGSVAAVGGGDRVREQMRQLLRYRLASHLLGAYAEHLSRRAEALRQEGGAEAAAELESAAAALPLRHRGAQQVPPRPVDSFAADFLEALPEVPQQPLPRTPDAAGPAAASPAAVSSHLPLPSTPISARPSLPPSAARAGGKPPLHPSALKGQRRISFGMGEEPRVNRPNSGDTPLDKMLVQLAGPGRGLGSLPEEAADMEADAAPGPGGEEQEEEQWGGQVADRPLTEDELRLGRTFTEEERRVWEALPETAKRLSLDGIMSFDAHMAVEAAVRQHEACSSKTAVEDRALRGALGMLPRTFMRVKGIFGVSGPNALKQQQVVARLRSTDETHSVADVERQLQLLAEHAAECVALRPYGSCGTPAVWWDRRAERASNGAVYRRLKQVAEARRSSVGAEPALTAAAAAAVVAAAQ